MCLKYLKLKILRVFRDFQHATIKSTYYIIYEYLKMYVLYFKTI